MNYNVFEMLKNGSNPQQVVMTMLQGPLANTPMGAGKQIRFFRNISLTGPKWTPLLQIP